MTPIELEDFPGFFKIPGYSDYGISEDGRVLNITNGNFLEGSRNPAGYVNIRLTNDSRITLTWGRHRLMCYVFKHPGCSIHDLYVNHKNLIKGDDFLDNLEWITPGGNIRHAGLNGVEGLSVPVLVRDVVTGEITQYDSIIDCAVDLGFSKDAIAYRVKIGDKRVFPEMKQYKKLFDKSEWFIPENLERELESNANINPVLLRFVETNEVYRFESHKDLSLFLNTPISTLSQWIHQSNQPVLPGLIQLKKIDGEEWRYVEDVYSELEENTKLRSIVVMNDITGGKAVFSTAAECARFIDIRPTTLNERLKSKGLKVYADGYRVCYYSDYLKLPNSPLDE